jgi:hypothetical protein
VRVFDRNLRSRMPLVPTHVRLKLLHACGQWHSSRVPLLLPVRTLNLIQTLKARLARRGEAPGMLRGRTFQTDLNMKFRRAGNAYGARFTADVCTRGMPLDPTHVRLKFLHACDQWHSSRASTPLTGWCCKSWDGVLAWCVIDSLLPVGAVYSVQTLKEWPHCNS